MTQPITNFYRIYIGMTLHTLDFIFPFFCLAYGAFVCLALEIPLKSTTPDWIHDLHNQLNKHRVLALSCLLVGIVWSLQNLFIEL